MMMIVIMSLVVAVIMTVVVGMTVIFGMIMAVIVRVIVIAATVVTVAVIMVVVVIMRADRDYWRFFLREGGLRGAVDFPQRHSVLTRQPDALLVFRGERFLRPFRPRQLAGDLAEDGLHGMRFPLPLRPLQRLLADPQGSGFGEQQLFQLAHILRPREDREQHAGTVFLHLNRRRPGIQRAELQQPLLHVADDFARKLIEVRFQLHDVIA